jgi:signal transduction histidine kinase
MPVNRFVIESISPSLRAMYHLGSRDVGDITLDALFDIGFGAEMPAQIAFCLQSGRPHRYTARREIAGTIRLLDVILAPVPAGPDEDRLIAASMRDVTDVEQREEQLRQSQKMDAVGQLTGGLAHDFNNLLTGITGSLELMSTRIAQGRIGALDRYIDTAQEAAQRAAALTHRLLAFSRRQTLDPRATEVGDVVDGMEELIRRTVGPAITVEVNADADLWTTLIDANQLENALLNLCLNARDAMPSGGRLSVTVANATTGQVRPASPDSSGEVPPGRYVRLSVIDTGTGMTPDVIARAFDPFFTTKPIGQGTGLGLSMIYGFVRQSGGHVQMASKAGEGTAVCLYLPRLEVLPVDVDTDLPVPLADLGTASHNEVVLVVDDELAVRTIVVEVLEELGYRTLQAEDAAGGLALLQSSARIDLLISDVGLPNGMNGRQMADAARIVRPELKVLFITGYAENAVLGDGGLPSGMQVLTKPFTMGRLTSRIETLLEPATVLVS